jgi:hypothetical protein
MKQETLEEAAESRYGTDMDSIRGSNVYDLNTDLKRGFVEGAKWQAERMYSEEEVIKIVEKSRETGLTAEFLLLTEQFKKK